MRILFIGNSYTYENDLPGTFARLSCSGGRPVETGMVAEGGWTLAQHAASADTLAKIAEKWDYVVLQEQSEIPAVAASRSLSMFPAARVLVQKIRESGAKPLFFLTFGHRGGLPDAGLPTYAAMQGQLDAGYHAIASELGVSIVPVGDVWYTAQTRPDPLDLWQADGSHPNPQGTYLAACVFYADLFRETPAGLSYHADLPQETAESLQSLAAQSVLQTK